MTTRKIFSVCNTEIYVKNANTTFRFGCPISSIIYQTLTVNVNQSVDVRADYNSLHTSGTFYHCMGFGQNGNFSLNLHNKLLLNYFQVDKKSLVFDRHIIFDRTLLLQGCINRSRNSLSVGLWLSLIYNWPCVFGDHECVTVLPVLARLADHRVIASAT